MELLRNYFNSKNVEYFSVLAYSDCREILGRLIEREGFEPRSVILYLLPYYVGETVNISRYAASLDYHLAIKEIGEGLCNVLSEKFPTSRSKSFGDHSPINEIGAALASGLGILGENGLLINEKYGSYVFVGDVVTDIPPEVLGATSPMPILKCEGCGACLAACPTGILRGEGEDCLSAITQKKGVLSADEEALMIEYNTAWGCDECQRVCPHNASPQITPIDFFKKDNVFSLTREALDSMTDEEFSRRAFAWRKRATVERNLEILSRKAN